MTGTPAIDHSGRSRISISPFPSAGPSNRSGLRSRAAARSGDFGRAARGPLIPDLPITSSSGSPARGQNSDWHKFKPRASRTASISRTLSRGHLPADTVRQWGVPGVARPSPIVRRSAGSARIFSGPRRWTAPCRREEPVQSVECSAAADRGDGQAVRRGARSVTRPEVAVVGQEGSRGQTAGERGAGRGTTSTPATPRLG
jgi:hypothetical protein